MNVVTWHCAFISTETGFKRQLKWNWIKNSSSNLDFVKCRCDLQQLPLTISHGQMKASMYLSDHNNYICKSVACILTDEHILNHVKCVDMKYTRYWFTEKPVLHGFALKLHWHFLILMLAFHNIAENCALTIFVRRSSTFVLWIWMNKKKYRETKQIQCYFLVALMQQWNKSRVSKIP